MKLTICDITNIVNHTNLLSSVHKYSRNSSDVVKLTEYPLIPVMKNSKLYNLAFTTETKNLYRSAQQMRAPRI